MEIDNPFSSIDFVNSIFIFNTPQINVESVKEEFDDKVEMSESRINDLPKLSGSLDHFQKRKKVNIQPLPALNVESGNKLKECSENDRDSQIRGSEEVKSNKYLFKLYDEYVRKKDNGSGLGDSVDNDYGESETAEDIVGNSEDFKMENGKLKYKIMMLEKVLTTSVPPLLDKNLSTFYNSMSKPNEQMLSSTDFLSSNVVFHTPALTSLMSLYHSNIKSLTEANASLRVELRAAAEENARITTVANEMLEGKKKQAGGEQGLSSDGDEYKIVPQISPIPPHNNAQSKLVEVIELVKKSKNNTVLMDSLLQTPTPVPRSPQPSYSTTPHNFNVTFFSPLHTPLRTAVREVVSSPPPSLPSPSSHVTSRIISPTPIIHSVSYAPPVEHLMAMNRLYKV
jgi:hypothetical protein